MLVWILRELLCLNDLEQWLQGLLSWVSLQMHYKVVTFFERLTALTTWKGPLSRMTSLVNSKITSLFECFSTLVARKWPLPCMNSLVNLEGCKKSERFLTLFTFVRVFSSMNPFMLNQTFQACKWFVTDLTRWKFLFVSFSMAQFVNFQPVISLECLIAIITRK